MTTLEQSAVKENTHQIKDRFKDILLRFIKSGINISPAALILIEQLHLTTSDQDKFIEKLSFKPNFDYIITVETIKNAFPFYFTPGFKNNTPIHDNPQIKEELIKNGYGNPENVCIPPLEKQNNNEISENNDLNLRNQKYLTGQNNEDSSDITEKPLKTTVNPKTPSSQVLKLPIRKRKSADDIDQILNEDLEGSEENEEIFDEPFEELEPVQPLNEEEQKEIDRIREEKKKQWVALSLNSSTTTFHPLAADYSEQFQVIKDPSGKLYTGGKIEEFLSVQKDKFEQLKKILTKRPEVSDFYDINYINRLQNSCQVKFIGMVTEKRQTANKNFILSLEDPTGIVSVLVRQNGPSKETYNLMEKLLPDHVVFIEGNLVIDAQQKKRLIHANSIIFPDTKKSNNPNFPQEDIAAAFISDTHFGSKDWVEKVWRRFVEFLKCRIGNDRQIEQAGKIKYMCIAGDIVDGIGVYPNQEKRLDILDIYQQYEFCAKLLAEIPDYITIVLSPGDHDAVRKALPTGAIPKEIAPNLYNSRIKMVGCPAYVSLHGIITLMYHGTSLIDMNMSIPGLKNEDPSSTMKELLRARHLVPTYGKKTELAPCETDWLVIDPVPDIFHTGHLHKNGLGWYNGILTVNSGCFQSQTDYMKSFGINPDIGKPSIINLKGPKFVPYVIDLLN